MSLWFLVKVFFYQEISATNSFENLIVFKWRKNPWLLELRKTFLPTYFSVEITKFGKFTLISPESRHCLYFPTKLLMLRKTTCLDSPISTTIVLIFSSTARCCPSACPAYVYLREAKQFCGTQANPIKGPTQALEALCGDRNISSALEAKCFGKTWCLLSFFNRQGSKVCYCSSGKRVAPTW